MKRLAWNPAKVRHGFALFLVASFCWAYPATAPKKSTDEDSNPQNPNQP